MKKRYILIIGIMILCILGCGNPSSKNDTKLIKQVFGIDEKKYELITVDNKLFKRKYDGSLIIKLNVHKDQMDMFKSEIKKAGFFLPTDEENYDICIKNAIGIKVTSNDTIYERMGSVKRKISVALEPMTVMSFVYYSKCIDNIYQVYMIYVE
jgi:hypothetical protein